MDTHSTTRTWGKTATVTLFYATNRRVISITPAMWIVVDSPFIQMEAEVPALADFRFNRLIIDKEAASNRVQLQVAPTTPCGRNLARSRIAEQKRKAARSPR